MKALVGAFNQEKALLGAFSVIVQAVVEPMDRFTALDPGDHCLPGACAVPGESGRVRGLVRAAGGHLRVQRVRGGVRRALPPRPRLKIDNPPAPVLI